MAKIGHKIAAEMLCGPRQLDERWPRYFADHDDIAVQFLQMLGDMGGIGVVQIAKNRTADAELFDLARGRRDIFCRSCASGDVRSPSAEGSTGASLNHAI